MAANDLKTETDYYLDKLGFEHDLPMPCWEFISFGKYKLMLGECTERVYTLFGRKRRSGLCGIDATRGRYTVQVNRLGLW